MKIVGNHFVVDAPPYCVIKPLESNPKFRVWKAQDYAEDEMEVETFALKFGSVELADAFEEKFNAVKSGEYTATGPAPKPAGAKEKAPQSPTKSSAQAAATTPAKSPEKSPAKSPEKSPSKSPEKEAAKSGGVVFSGFAASSASSNGLFSAAASGVGGAAFKLDGNGTGPFGSGSSSGGIFGSGTSTFGGSSGGGGIFGGANGGIFGTPAGSSGGLFSGLPKVGAEATKEKSPEKAADAQKDDEYVEEHEVAEIDGWKAEITLDVKEKVDTGEEEEEELYAQRSKLFRMRDGEWKERGLGTAKLLKHKESGQIRFLLRQEKTMKIVGNHFVVDAPPYCVIKPLESNPKFRIWKAQDYSEDEMEVETFALKFGSVELADAFQEKFNAVKSAEGTASGPAPKPAGAKETASQSPTKSSAQATATTPAKSPEKSPAKSPAKSQEKSPLESPEKEAT